VTLWLLTSRLRFFEDRKRYSIGDEKIERPLFATGEPRSGTTLLHALLAQDPNGRVLRFWELMHPSPPPGLAREDDLRRAFADEQWRQILALIPRWLIGHPYNDMLGDGLPECERTWAFDFRAMPPTAWWNVPAKPEIGSQLPRDPHAQYGLHKMMLQHCQYARPRKYWVLKGFHGQTLQALFDTYPDANIIWVHRDPVQVMASRIVLLGEIVEAISGTLDRRSFARSQAAITRSNIRSILAEPLMNDPRVFNVRYPDFTRDPVGTLRLFYEHSGVPFTPGAEAGMRDYLARNKGDRYGKFQYSLDAIGEDIEALHREFASYRERFGLDIETRR
jgi:hypothetical protein